MPFSNDESQYFGYQIEENSQDYFSFSNIIAASSGVPYFFAVCAVTSTVFLGGEEDTCAS